MFLSCQALFPVGVEGHAWAHPTLLPAGWGPAWVGEPQHLFACFQGCPGGAAALWSPCMGANLAGHLALVHLSLSQGFREGEDCLLAPPPLPRPPPRGLFPKQRA